MLAEHKKLFLEIRKSPFWKEYPIAGGGVMTIYYASQKDKIAGKQTLVRTVKKGGSGTEQLYAPDGKPILEVGLKRGKPYGRARMFDENGVQTFPNTYWYYGAELWGAFGHFELFEEEEKALIQEEKEALKKNTDPNKVYAIQKAYSIRKNKIYTSKEFYSFLKFDAALLALEVREEKALFKNSLHKGR